jgi:hypothetical protein
MTGKEDCNVILQHVKNVYFRKIGYIYAYLVFSYALISIV